MQRNLPRAAMPKSIALPPGLDEVKERLQLALQAQGEIPSDFDLNQWLEDWLQRPQPALGGSRPIELLNTRSGVEAICRTLGAAISGAYQ